MFDFSEQRVRSDREVPIIAQDMAYWARNQGMQ